MNDFYVDGYKLNEARKGLSIVTESLVVSLSELNNTRNVFLIIPSACNLAVYGLFGPKIKVVFLDYFKFSVNYLDRVSWARSILFFQRQNKVESIIFPYQMNAGFVASNYVYFPDLIGLEEQINKFSFSQFIRRFFEERERRLVVKAKKIFTYSEYVKSELIKRYPYVSGRVNVVPLAPQTGLIKLSREEALGVLGLKSTRRFLIYVGGYAERKNTGLLADACLRVYNKNSDFHCVFVGGSSDSRIRGLAELNPNVITALNYLDVRMLSAYYSLCDFALYPSHAEGFGLPIVEAGVLGKPCLCGDNSSQVEIQVDELWRVDSTNVIAWVDRIIEYWNDPIAVKNASLSALHNSGKYSWPLTAASVVDLISSK